MISLSYAATYASKGYPLKEGLEEVMMKEKGVQDAFDIGDISLAPVKERAR